jgi:YHS domain-containing protein
MLIVAGCASSQHTASTQPCEKCLVCEKNADLACVDVAVDANTPRYDYAGKTYYFCSEECRAKFAGSPQKYLP